MNRIIWDNDNSEPARGYDDSEPIFEMMKDGFECVGIKELTCICNPDIGCGGCVDVINWYKIGERFVWKNIQNIKETVMNSEVIKSFESEEFKVELTTDVENRVEFNLLKYDHDKQWKKYDSANSSYWFDDLIILLQEARKWCQETCIASKHGHYIWRVRR